MNGRIVVIGIACTTAAFAITLYYFQVYAFYERASDVTRIETVAGPLAVSGYDGIDAPTSPVKLRACFTADAAALEALPAAPEGTPLNPPYWFTCFDAGQLAADIDAGRATVRLAQEESDAGAPYRIARFIAAYPDGRGFMWRQLFETR